ncbi:MAG: hypothetical protein ABI536_09020, partial [Gallionella sp.]
FCGLGNFTLPIARSGAQVLGIEGSAALVARARQNAVTNGLDKDSLSRRGITSDLPASGLSRMASSSSRVGVGAAEFAAMNLFAMTAEGYAALGRFDKLLIDPPRDGAMELVKSLGGENAPRRIVYVSCNPATLARDAQVLVQHGYTLKAAGVMNMFPHTSHVESIAVFVKE